MKNMYPDLQGKIAVVTGGSSGIGLVAVKYLHSLSVKVIACSRNIGQLESVINNSSKGDSKIEFLEADIRKEDDIKKLYDYIFTHYGRLDLAFNNAGISCNGNLMDLVSKDFDNVFLVNTKGVWLSMKYQLMIMKCIGSGSIVNNISVHGIRAVFENIGAYVASKHAAVGLTKVAAIEVARLGIRVNGIAPGPINTEMFAASAKTIGGSDVWISKIPQRRPGEAFEVASTVAWLFSNQSSYITGQIIGVDGGFLAT